MKSAAFRSTLLVLSCLAAGPALSESLATSASSAGSSASSAGSASLRGSSDSISSSSDSSRNNERVAEGDYRVAAIATLADRPGMLRLTLAPVAGTDGAGGFRLDLPERALGPRGIAAGDVISALHRPYGLEFARRDTREAFFLVLADDWHRDLETRVVAN
ncbi:MAG: hypothetical protein AB7G13_21380 [Lautropia sp.]